MAFDCEVRGARIRLFQEDCIAGMRERLAAGSVSVIVTSPPYNLGVKYSQYDDTQSREAYLEWLGRWADAVREVLAEDGSLFLNIGGKPTDPWVPFEVLMTMRARGLRLQNVIHWIKSIAIEKADVGDYPGITGDVAVGHFKPINSRRFLNDCQEYVFHLTKSGAVPLDRLAIGVKYQDSSNITRWKSAGGGLRCRGNTWFVPYDTIRSRDEQRPHPATFPVELARKCIRLHGVARTKLVLDPFLGIGHAAVAAVSLERDFVGFEIDGAYLREAIENVQRAGTERSQLRLFEEDPMGSQGRGTHLMHVAIRARDPGETRRFYEEGLGMRFIGVRPSGAGAFDLADGRTNLTIIPYDGPERPRLEEGTEQIHFGFLVEDATATFRRLTAMGYTMLKENVKTRDPVKEPDPRGSFKVADPDGNVIDVTGNPQEWRV